MNLRQNQQEKNYMKLNKELELYVKVTEALRLTEQVFNDAGKALEQLRSAQKHLDFRMDEWMQQYEDYNETQQRRLDRAHWDGYYEGYQDAELLLKDEYESKVNEAIQAETVRYVNKTLVETGEPTSAVIVNETILSNGTEYLPPRLKILENGTIIEQPIKFHNGTFYNYEFNETDHSINQTIWKNVGRHQDHLEEEVKPMYNTVKQQYISNPRIVNQTRMNMAGYSNQQYFRNGTRVVYPHPTNSTRVVNQQPITNSTRVVSQYPKNGTRIRAHNHVNGKAAHRPVGTTAKPTHANVKASPSSSTR